MNADRFDAVVIGSGFGGAVAACRLAQAGQRVLILERGRRYPRGSFPRDMKNIKPWTYAQEQGLLEMKPLLTEMLAMQVAGYGGGSLLYNNVQLRPPKQLFDDGWPTGFSRETLDPYYDLVGYMLDIKPLAAKQPLGLPARTQHLRQVAQTLGRSEQFFLPNLAVNFAEPGVATKNKFGVTQQGCTHCGECIIGCNQHAKNTLDLNYLAVAESLGATVRTRCQANRIEPDGDGYRVVYSDFAANGAPSLVSARRVFLCAGAVNSTELLLRCRDEHRTLPQLSRRLGYGYSANGDFLAVVFRTKEPMLPTRGPCITSALLFDRGAGKKDHVWFLLEDGGAPAELALPGQGFDPKRSPVNTGRALWDDLMRSLGAPVAASPTDEEVAHSMVLLLMGQDHASGHMTIEPNTGQLRMRWELPPNLPLYNAQTRLAEDVAAALGGELTLNPTWKLLHQPMTIHNLGGCAMADSAEAGVTNAHGEVFGHPGLFVLDGAIIPRAIGANPSHTIAAVAERSIEEIIRGITANPTWKAPERALAPPIHEPFDRVHVPVEGTREPQHSMIGLAFKETMTGSLHRQWTPADDFLGAARRGQQEGHKLEFTLDIVAPDVNAFLADRDHTAIASGHLRADGFTGPEGIRISGGVFNLFSPTAEADARQMLYALPFYGQDGQPYLLDGFKDVRDHGSFDVWEANTTLYTVIREGHTRQGAIRASGIMRIDLLHVLQMVASMEVTGGASAIERATTLERFSTNFFGTLWQVYVKSKLPKMPWSAT